MGKRIGRAKVVQVETSVGNENCVMLYERQYEDLGDVRGGKQLIYYHAISNGLGYSKPAIFGGSYEISFETATKYDDADGLYCTLKTDGVRYWVIADVYHIVGIGKTEVEAMADLANNIYDMMVIRYILPNHIKAKEALKELREKMKEFIDPELVPPSKRMFDGTVSRFIIDETLITDVSAKSMRDTVLRKVVIKKEVEDDY